jgi:hypothetical protein
MFRRRSCCLTAEELENMQNLKFIVLVAVVLLQPAGERGDQVELQLLHAVYVAGVILKGGSVARSVSAIEEFLLINCFTVRLQIQFVNG